MNKTRARKAVSLILSFIICICFCGVLLSVDLMMGFCNSTNVRDSIRQCSYTQEAYRDFKEKTAQLAKEQNIPKWVFKDIVKEEDFYLESAKAIKGSLSGEDVNIHETQVSADASKRMKAYMRQQKITVDADLTSAIGITSKTVGSYYRENVSFEFGKYFREYSRDILGAVKVMLPICLVLTVILSVVLCRMYHHKHKGLRFVSYGILGAVTANAVAAVYLMSGSFLDFEGVSKGYVKFADNYVSNCLMPFWITAGIGLMVFTVLLYITSRSKNSEK